MHKTLKTTISIVAGLGLALAVPLAAEAAPVVPASATHSVVATHVTSKGHDSHAVSYTKPTPKPTKPAYPPTKPPKPPVQHHHPFWHGGFWWFPFIFPAHTFHPGATVHVFITGFGGFSFFGTFQASESGSLSLGTAAADGSLNATLKATGAKDLAGQTLNATVTDNSGTSVSQSITVPSATTKTASVATKPATVTSAVKSVDSATLAQSGTYISLVTVWGAVGLLALGGGFLAMRTVTRRRSRTDL